MRTTVTLHPVTINYLVKTSERLRIKPSELLRLCLFKWFRAHRGRISYSRKVVEYQPADVLKYKRVHVSFSFFEYESFIDSRKLLKRSVSSIATEAIYEFAKILLNNFGYEYIDLDTYPFCQYKVKRIENNDHIKWNYYWFPVSDPEKKTNPGRENKKT